MTSVLPDPVGALSKNSNSPAARRSQIASTASFWSAVSVNVSPGAMSSWASATALPLAMMRFQIAAVESVS